LGRDDLAVYQSMFWNGIAGVDLIGGVCDLGGTIIWKALLSGSPSRC
jgi:hypothetical protein